MPDDEETRRRADEERRRRRDMSNRARQRNDQGRQFHLGMAQIRGETRENGWRNEHVVETSLGDRRHDTARVVDPNDKQFSEYKNVRRLRDDPRTLLQLAKDREQLEKGWSGNWVIPQAARIDPAIAKQLGLLLRDFPDRFTVVRVSEAERRQAVQVGKQLERNRNQLELVTADKLRDQERVRQRAERARQIARTQEAAAQSNSRATARRTRQTRTRRLRARNTLTTPTRSRQSPADRTTPSDRSRTRRTRTPRRVHSRRTSRASPSTRTRRQGTLTMSRVRSPRKKTAARADRRLLNQAHISRTG